MDREGGKHQCVAASRTPPPEDLACNPGMCHDWELNRRPFGSQSGVQSTEPHPARAESCIFYHQRKLEWRQPGQSVIYFYVYFFNLFFFSHLRVTEWTDVPSIQDLT